MCSNSTFIFKLLTSFCLYHRLLELLPARRWNVIFCALYENNPLTLHLVALVLLKFKEPILLCTSLYGGFALSYLQTLCQLLVWYHLLFYI